MKINFNFSVILLTLSIITLISGLFLIKSQNNRLINSNKILTDDFNDFKTIILEKDSIERLSNHIKLKEDFVLTDEIGKMYKISALIGETKKIILRYPELSCTSCYQEQMMNINNLIEKIGYENVLILTAYQNPRDVHTFKRTNKLNKNVFNTIENDLGLALEKKNVPYLFVLDSNLHTRMAFMPLKNFPQLTDSYFELLMRIFEIDSLLHHP